MNSIIWPLKTNHSRSWHWTQGGLDHPENTHSWRFDVLQKNSICDFLLSPEFSCTTTTPFMGTAMSWGAWLEAEVELHLCQLCPCSIAGLVRQRHQCSLTAPESPSSWPSSKPSHFYLLILIVLLYWTIILSLVVLEYCSFFFDSWKCHLKCISFYLYFIYIYIFPFFILAMKTHSKYIASHWWEHCIFIHRIGFLIVVIIDFLSIRKNINSNLTWIVLFF